MNKMNEFVREFIAEYYHINIVNKMIQLMMNFVSFGCGWVCMRGFGLEGGVSREVLLVAKLLSNNSVIVFYTLNGNVTFTKH